MNDLVLTEEERGFILSRRSHENELAKKKKSESEVLEKERAQVKELRDTLTQARFDHASVAYQMSELQKKNNDVYAQIANLRYRLRETCSHVQPLTANDFIEDYCPDAASDWSMVCFLCQSTVDIRVQWDLLDPMCVGERIAMDKHTRRVFRTATKDEISMFAERTNV